MPIDMYALKKGDKITLRNGEVWEVRNRCPSWLTCHQHHIYAIDPIAYISNHYYDDGSINGNGLKHAEDIVEVAPS